MLVLAALAALGNYNSWPTNRLRARLFLGFKLNHVCRLIYLLACPDTLLPSTPNVPSTRRSLRKSFHARSLVPAPRRLTPTPTVTVIRRNTKMRVAAISFLVAAPALVSAAVTPIRRDFSGAATWYYTQTGNAYVPHTRPLTITQLTSPLQRFLRLLFE